MGTRRVVIEFLGQDKSAGDTAEKVESKTAKLGTTLTSVGKMAAVGLAGGLLAAGAAAVKFIGDAEESARVGRLTENVVRSTGGAAKITADQVGELAGAISNKTGADDEAIQSGQNLLLTFTNVRNEAGKGNNIFDQASETIVDMAAAMNNGEVSAEGMKGSSIQLGKALNDPVKGISALSKVGVSFTEQQKKQIKEMVKAGDVLGAQKVILGELKKEFGGAATAAASPMDRLKTIAGNLSEQLGGYLLPAVDKFATFVGTKAVPAISGLADLIIKGDFTSTLAKAFNLPEDSKFVATVLRIRTSVINTFKEIRGGIIAFGSAWKANDGDVTSSGFPGFMERLAFTAHKAFDYFRGEVMPRLKEFAGYVSTKVVPVIRQWAEDTMVKARIVLEKVKKAIQDNRPQLEQLGAWIVKVGKWVAESLLPMLAKTSNTALPILSAAIGSTITVVGRWISIFNSLKKTVQTVVGFLWTKISGFFQNLLDGAAHAFGWVPGIGPKLKAAQTAFKKFRDDVNNSLNGIDDQTITVTAKLNATQIGNKNANDRRLAGAGYKAGGPVTGGIPGADSVPAWLMPDEHVLTVDDVKAMGGHGAVYKFRQKLHRFAKGGAVGFNVKAGIPGEGARGAFSAGVAAGAVAAVKSTAQALADKLSSSTGSVQNFRGERLNSRTINMLVAAERILGRAFNIMQGSYSTRVAASGGTHAGGGVMDVDGPGGWNRAVSALRRVGFAAWHRTPAQGPWGHHIHAVAIGDGTASPSARRQVQDFLRGGDGLGSYRNGTPYVPADGLYRLHKGERVTPEAENRRQAAAGEEVIGVLKVIHQTPDGKTMRTELLTLKRNLGGGDLGIA